LSGKNCLFLPGKLFLFFKRLDMNILYPDFLTNKDDYIACVQVWEIACTDVLEKQAQRSDWNYGEYEMTPHSADSAMGGNPVYWLVNVRQKKGVRIIQLDPQIQTKWAVTAYTDKSGDEFLPYGTRAELVFVCQLTEDAVLKFKVLFEAWAHPDCTVTKLEELIHSVVG
jgi:hypothetical protein